MDNACSVVDISSDRSAIWRGPARSGAIAIWRDGLAAWGIPPCKDYIDACANIPVIKLFN